MDQVLQKTGRPFLAALRDRLWWAVLWLFLGSCALGLLSLLYAAGPYGLPVCLSYLRHPWILFLNIAPVVVLTALLFCLYGRAWPAFLTGSVLVIGFSFGDYYMLKLRDDPLMFQDLESLKEGLAVSAQEHYDLWPDEKQLLGIACVVAGVLFFRFLARGRIVWRFRRRLALALVPAALLAGLFLLCQDRTLYDRKTVNNDAVNQWGATQIYLSRGFVYPFLHSVTANRMEKPAGYRDADAIAALGEFQDADIPAERRVSLVTLQLEAFSDLSRCGAAGVDWDRAYGTYHEILAESYHGQLLNNVFAGGTVNTERAFLTGFAQLKNFRSAANSYARYLAAQGYTVYGSHPSYQWFYNRKNINSFLGFPDYYFYENRYGDLAGNATAPDSVLLPDIFALFEDAAADGSPVFSFNVSYQGHGPYSDTEVHRGLHFTDGRYSQESSNILDNYLGSVQDTAENLRALLDAFNTRSEPVAVVVYGDHKPWLGNNGSVYEELGISLDPSEEAGLFHKYSTDYFLWGNDAARELLGADAFSGQGETISPNFLMNVVFERLGWQGNAWMQFTESIRREMPVLTTIGRLAWEGQYLSEAELPQEGKDVLQRFRLVQYYWENRADVK